MSGRTAKRKSEVDKLKYDIKFLSKAAVDDYHEPKILIRKKSVRKPQPVEGLWEKASGKSLGTKVKRIDDYNANPVTTSPDSPNLLSLNPIGLPDGVGSCLALYDYRPEFKVKPSEPERLRSPEKKPTAHHYDDELLSVLPGKTAVETWKRLDTDRDVPNPEEAIVHEYYRPLEIKVEQSKAKANKVKPPPSPPKPLPPPEPKKVKTPSISPESSEEDLPKIPSKKEIPPPEPRKSIAKPPRPPPEPPKPIEKPPPEPTPPPKKLPKKTKIPKYKPPPVKQPITEEKPKPAPEPPRPRKKFLPKKIVIIPPKLKSSDKNKSDLKGILKKKPAKAENEDRQVSIANRPPWDSSPYINSYSNAMAYGHGHYNPPVAHGNSYASPHAGGANGYSPYPAPRPPSHPGMQGPIPYHSMQGPAPYPALAGPSPHADLQGPSGHPTPGILPYHTPYSHPGSNSCYSQNPPQNSYAGSTNCHPCNQRDIYDEYNRHVSRPNPNILNSDMMSMMPIRTHAFPAPYVPVRQISSSDSCESECGPDGRQKKHSKGDNNPVGFKYASRADCATEVSVTVEPRKQPLWQTMMNCGFRPVISCQAPPYVIQDSEEEYRPSCRERDRCRVLPYPYPYPFPPPQYNPQQYYANYAAQEKRKPESIKKEKSPQSSPSSSDEETEYESDEYDYEYGSESTSNRNKKYYDTSYISDCDKDDGDYNNDSDDYDDPD